MLKAILTFLALLALSVCSLRAQTPPKPTYSWVTLSPQGSTPSPISNGLCWTQTDGLHCYYSGAAHGPFLASGGTTALTIGNTTIASGTTGRVLYDNGGLLGEYTSAQLTALINSFSSSLSGAAPASGGGTTNFLRADGSWAAPAGTVSPGGSSGNIQYNNSGAFGGLTDTQLTTHINAFSSTLSGAAPLSGGGTSNFLRADGTWAVPPGTTSGTVTTSGSPANGNLTKFTGAAVISNGDLSGDATTSGTLAVTVAKINGATLGTTTATSGNDLVANGSQWVSVATSGDCTRASGGALTCTKTNGVNFATSATTDATNAANISSGTLPAGRLPALTGDVTSSAGSAATTLAAGSASNLNSGTLASARGGAGTISGALKGNGSGVVSQAACADLSNGGTACTAATGTSGATLPFLNGTNTWSAAQTHNSGTLKLAGATSGTTTLNAAGTAGTTTITLPGGTTDFSATGGSSQVVKQTSSGGAFTVGQLACSDLSNGATGCSTATGTSGGTIPLLNAANTWSASQAGSITTLSISTATFTPNASNNHYYVLLVHASCPCTIANPSPAFVAGTTGVIEIQQSSTGSDTIGTWGSSYMAPGGVASIVLSTAANAIDVVSYYVIDSTHILLIPALNFSH